MNYDRIRPTVDIDRMAQSHVTIVGGAYGLAQDLVRCGLGALTYVDFDSVDATNPARQDFSSSDIGRYKVDALAASLKQIDPDVEVSCLIRDFCEIGRDEFDVHFGHTDLFIFATDFFPAQARGNQEAIRLGKPAVWIGLYRGGRAGEIVYYVPGVTPACFRCICSARYAAFSNQARATEGSTTIPSTGGIILDLHLVDAIAGQIVLGILTAGADNRMGRLIQQLGTRNILQTKIDPEYRLGEPDVFAEHLGTDAANFAFSTIALPMSAEDDCPDCGGGIANCNARETLGCGD
jgi:molybdopterin/thiamine biosynthesis adenylyltransferase